MKRIPQLDGIRGLAILLILIWHYYVSLPPGETNGLHALVKQVFSLSWSGVDLFFVLSGFLIGGILLDNKSAKNVFSVFYYRRFFRIIPLYAIFLIPYLIISSSNVWQDQKGLSWLFKNPLPLWSYASFTQNYFMIKAGTFGPHWSAITWSLAIEEQFYLLLPLSIWILPSKTLPSFFIFTIISAIFFRFIFSFIVVSQYANYVLLPCRTDSLVLGVLGAWLVRQPDIVKELKESPWVLNDSLLVSGTGMIIFSYIKLPPGSLLSNTIGLPLIATFYFIFIMFCVINTNTFLNRILCSKILRGLGFISYCIYLTHLVFLGLCHAFILKHIPQNNDFTDTAVTLLALFLTLIVSAISWRFFEKPLSGYSHRLKYEPSSAK
jgi:peptidoglycan/LPS O-acetylase OafA/YrhL